MYGKSEHVGLITTLEIALKTVHDRCKRERRAKGEADLRSKHDTKDKAYLHKGASGCVSD